MKKLVYNGLVIVGRCKHKCAAPIIWGLPGEQKDEHGMCADKHADRIKKILSFHPKNRKD